MNVVSRCQNLFSAIAAHPLGERLLQASIELVLLASVVWLAIHLCRIRTPRVCALLWLLVMAKAAVGLIAGGPLRLATMPLTSSAPLATAEPAAMIAETDQWQSSARTEKPVDNSPQETRSERAGEFASPATSPSLPKAISKPSARVRRHLSVVDVVIGIWFGGVVLMLGLTGIDQHRIQRLRRNTIPTPVGLLDLMREEARRIGLSKLPDLQVSERLDSPVRIGLFRPAILIPAWMTSEERGRLRWVVAHELMHGRMRDPIGLAVRRLAQMLLWFHPVVWWAGRRWEEAMELACDRALVQADGQAREYAAHLYGLLEKLVDRRKQAPAGAALFATLTQVGRRVAALLAQPLRTQARLGLASRAGLFVTAVLGLMCGIGFQAISSDHALPAGDMSQARFVASAKAQSQSQSATTQAIPPSSTSTQVIEPLPGAINLPGTLVFQGRYKHRNRGAEIPVPSELWIKQAADGSLTAVASFRNSLEIVSGDPQHRITAFRSGSVTADNRPGYRLDLVFRENLAVLNRRGIREDWDNKELSVPAGALFDPNSRPDTYCAANLLLRHFALKEGEAKEFRVFDWDNSGESMAGYTIQVKHAGREKIEVPAGTFEANHLVLTQKSSADTWFKKRAGHLTDFWVLDNGVIVRVLRHREPYEMLLLDYAAPAKLPGQSSGPASVSLGPPPIKPPGKLSDAPGTATKPAEVPLWEQIAQRRDPDLRRRSLAKLLEMIQGNSVDKLAALNTLRRVRDVPFDRKPFLPHIRAALTDHKPEVRAAALGAISIYGAKQDLAAISALASDPAPEVRQGVAFALFALDPEAKDQQTGPTIERLLKDMDPKVQRDTIRSVWGHPLTSAAEQQLIALTYIPALKEDVIYFALSTRPVVSEAVGKRLIELMDDLHLNDPSRVIWGLSHHPIKPEIKDRVIDALIRNYDETLNVAVRENCIFGLGAHGGAKALQKLQSIVASEENPKLVDAAGQALERLGER